MNLVVFRPIGAASFWLCAIRERMARFTSVLSLVLWFCAAPLASGDEGVGVDLDECRMFMEPGSADFDISEVPQPAEDVLFPKDAVIGEIVYTRYPIFNPNDPEENNMLFGLVDALHIDTRQQVIQSKLLFRPGDPVDKRVLEESARLLRDTDYLYDARVWPYRICGDRVDVEIVTREVWTLSGGASFSRSGSSEETEISISDSNFLGYGKTFSLSQTSSVDRDGIEFGYEDPNVGGSRYVLDLFYADNDDGFQTTVEAERPFYSLDTRYAGGIRYDDQEREDDLYELGEEVASFQTNLRESEVFLGVSGGWENGVTRRWWFGLRAREETYDTVEDEVAPDTLPDNRETNYPYIGLDFIEEDFIQVSNLNQMHRIEDFNLGRSWGWRLGFADKVFGSDASRLVYQANARDAWQLNKTTLMQVETALTGTWQYTDNRTEGLKWETNWRWYDGVGKKQGTYLALDLQLARNLLGGEQLLLGAEEQLRGYPDRYQNGTRSFVFSAERRFYTDWHLWRLVRVGGALFFDIGRAWEPGDDLSGPTGVLADAGFGLRLASSRAQTRQILHIDFAFPFQRHEDVDDLQILITAKQSF